MPAESTLEAQATSTSLHGGPGRPVALAGSWARIGTPVALLLATFVTYGAALRNGFVWDDHALILRDPLIRSWRLIGEGFQHFLFTDATGSDFYRPLQRLSYTLDYAIFFNSPLGYHLLSILWHAAAAIALYYFAEEFLARFDLASGRRTGVAFFAALIWALHPVQSAAVVYISGRADPLAATFGFLGLYLGIRSLRAARNGRWAFEIGAGVCLLASALSKEIGVIFLLVLLIIVIATARRSAWVGALGIAAAVLIAYLGLRLPAEHLPPPPQPPMPLLVRPILAARAVAEYAGLIAFPLHLHMDRDVETHPFGFSPASLDAAARRELQTLLGVIVIVAGFYLFYRARRRPAVFIPLLLALVSYLPVSGIIPLNATVAEHWLYLPSAFLFLAAAVAVDASRSRILFACLLVWVLFLPVRTFFRTFDWENQRAFLTRTIAAGGDSARMLINLGGLELSEGHLEAAKKVLEQALGKEPNNPLAQLSLATVETNQREFRSARKRLAGIKDPPELRARAEENLAILEAKESGEINLMRLRLAARIGPPNWQIEQRYIRALVNAELSARAIDELKTCLTIAPYRSESWLMMSQLLLKISLPNESAIAFAEAAATDVHLRERLGSSPIP